MANGTNDSDIFINGFEKTWNPEDTDEQVIWLNNKEDHRAACIYTSQGLDMDNVAFIWWSDLVWDENDKLWETNPEELKDPKFRGRLDRDTRYWHQEKWDKKSMSFVPTGYQLSQEDMDALIKNTYYVMLTRPRKKLGIWFKDIATREHVREVLKKKSVTINNSIL